MRRCVEEEGRAVELMQALDQRQYAVNHGGGGIMTTMREGRVDGPVHDAADEVGGSRLFCGHGGFRFVTQVFESRVP